jgi:hypothetical protein
VARAQALHLPPIASRGDDQLLHTFDVVTRLFAEVLVLVV